jgi:hypothetical protein
MPIEHLPAPVRPGLRSFRDLWWRSFGPIMAFMSVTAMAFGLSYFGIFGTYKARIHPIENLTSIEFWATLWVISGVAAGVLALWPKGTTRGYRAASSLVIFLYFTMCAIWAVSYWLGFIHGTLDRGIAMAVLFTVLPFLILHDAYETSRESKGVDKEKLHDVARRIAE